jgi:hypothetical protein
MGKKLLQVYARITMIRYSPSLWNPTPQAEFARLIAPNAGELTMTRIPMYPISKYLLTSKAIVERKKTVSEGARGSIDEWQMISPAMSCMIQPQKRSLADSPKIYDIYTAPKEDVRPGDRLTIDDRGQKKALAVQDVVDPGMLHHHLEITAQELPE